MKHLLLILIALLFCQCTNKKNDALLEIKEIESSYIDDSIKDIIIQYTQEYPQDSSLVLFLICQLILLEIKNTDLQTTSL